MTLRSTWSICAVAAAWRRRSATPSSDTVAPTAPGSAISSDARVERPISRVTALMVRYKKATPTRNGARSPRYPDRANRVLNRSFEVPRRSRAVSSLIWRLRNSM